uniref:Retroelement pol polyprotein n=1 Tax=Solanum tuberosum TaxID=4113 RepID=M1DKM4_SOLTU
MPIGAGERKDGLYYFRVVPQAMAIKNGSDSLDIWHKRLGHPSLRVTKLVSNVIPTNDSEMMNKDCDVCQRAKQTRDRFPLSENKVYDKLELVHCDLCGPYRNLSSCGASYFLTIVDDYSCAVWIFLLIDRKDMSHMILNFLAMVERQFNKQVKIIRSDNGTKFTCMKTYFLEQGIIFQSSCV